MKNSFSVEAIMTAVRATSDRGLSLGFHTKELTTEEKALVMNYHTKAGFLLFAEDSIQEDDIPKQDTDFQNKTPSQRLRAVLFVRWQQQGSKGKFQDYYETTMEGFITAVKAKLDD